MKHSHSYSQLNQAKIDSEIRKDNRIGVIASIVLFAMYCIVSTMDYNDCIKGVC